MTIIDGGYVGSYAPDFYPTGAGTGSNAPNAFAPTGGGTSANVDVDVASEVILISAAPDPVGVGETLIISGANLDLVQVLYIAGESVDWEFVSSTEIHVPILESFGGLQEIYAEYV